MQFYSHIPVPIPVFQSDYSSYLDFVLTVHLETIPVLCPESTAEDFTIGGTIQSKQTSQYLNIVVASTSYKPAIFGATGETTAWGLEGDTIVIVQGSSFGRRELISPSHLQLEGKQETIGKSNRRSGGSMEAKNGDQKNDKYSTMTWGQTPKYVKSIANGTHS